MGLVSWDWWGDASLVVTDFALACCALEVEAAMLQGDQVHLPLAGFHPAPPLGEVQTASSRAMGTGARRLEGDLPPGAVHVVTITGTVTNFLAAEIADLVASLGPEARPWIVAFGACASGGGPYWDSYSVLNGIDQVLPVDRYVPGCPPPPAALTAVLEELRALGPRVEFEGARA